MKIHSGEVRLLALQALERGEGRQNTARVFGIALGTLDRWWREYRRQGKSAPAERGRRRPTFEGGTRAALEAQLRATPDATAAQQVATWEQATGQRVSVSTLRRARIALGWTRKKRA